MKKYLMSLALAAAVSTPSFAQTTLPANTTESTTSTTTSFTDRANEPSDADYQRMMRNTYNGSANAARP